MRLTSFLRKYEMIECFVCCKKTPKPAKEISRAWAWALQQNIMGLSFKHIQLVLKHTQHDVPIYMGPIVLSVYSFRVSIKKLL